MTVAGGQQGYLAVGGDGCWLALGGGAAGAVAPDLLVSHVSQGAVAQDVEQWPGGSGVPGEGLLAEVARFDAAGAVGEVCLHRVAHGFADLFAAALDLCPCAQGGAVVAGGRQACPFLAAAGGGDVVIGAVAQLHARR